MKKKFEYTERKGLPGGPNETFSYTTGVFSTEGYKRNSPDVNNPFNIIPSGNITMRDVDFPVQGTDNLGNSIMMKPGYNYKFPGNMVFELPIKEEKNVKPYGNINTFGNMGVATAGVRSKNLDLEAKYIKLLQDLGDSGTFNLGINAKANKNNYQFNVNPNITLSGDKPSIGINAGIKKTFRRGGGLLTKNMQCNNCGWSWRAVDGGKDATTCHKCGGSVLPKAQEGREQSRGETRRTAPTYITPEMTVQAFPNATPAQRAALSIGPGNPIYRNAKLQLMNNKQAGNFVDETADAFGYLVAGAPMEGLQIPQSLLMEGIEAARGNDYNFKNTLPQYVTGATNKQRVPSQTFLQNAPFPLQLAGDILIDPFAVLGAAKGGISAARYVKNFPKAFALNLDDVGRQAFKPSLNTKTLSGSSNAASSIDNIPETQKLWRIQSKDFKEMTPNDIISLEIKEVKKRIKRDRLNKLLSYFNLDKQKLSPNQYARMIEMDKKILKDLPNDPTNKYYGQWFLDDKNVLKQYYDRSKTHGGYSRFKNPEILEIEIPKNKLNNYNVGTLAKNDELLGYVSENHLNEYIIPQKYKNSAKKYFDADEFFKEEYQQGGSLPTDKYTNPITTRIIYDNNVGRSYYDPRTNTMVLGKDYDEMSPEEKKNVIAHENFHAYQFDNDMSTYVPVGEAPIKKPPMVSTDEHYYKYHNRKSTESAIDEQDFINANPSFRFVPKKLIFNRKVDDQQYSNPYSMEGQATYYENTGEIFPFFFKDGGALPKAQFGIPTTADSIVLYNNAIQKGKFYKNNPNYIEAPSAWTDNSDISYIFDQLVKNKDYYNNEADMLYYRDNRYGSPEPRFNVINQNMIELGDILDGEPNYVYNNAAPSILLHNIIEPTKWVQYVTKSKDDRSDIPYYDPVTIYPKSLGPVPREAYRYSDIPYVKTTSSSKSTSPNNTTPNNTTPVNTTPVNTTPSALGTIRPFIEKEYIETKKATPFNNKILPNVILNPFEGESVYVRERQPQEKGSGLYDAEGKKYQLLDYFDKKTNKKVGTWDPIKNQIVKEYQQGGLLPKYQDGNGEYIVQAGNTFDGIANKKEVSKNLLRNMNPGIDYNNIKVGQVINVPDIKTKEERMQFFSDRRNTPMDVKDSPGISKIQTAISNGSTKQENPSYNKDILIDLSKVDKKELSKQQAERRQSLFNAANTVASFQGNNKDLEKLLVMTAVMENTLGIDDNAYGRSYTRGPMSIDDIAYKDLFEIRKGATKYTTQQKKNTAWLESLGINTSDIDSALRSDDPLTSMAVARLVYGRAPEALPSGDDQDALYNYYLKYYNKTGVDKYGGAEAHRDRFNDYYSEIYKELGGEVDKFQVYANYINGVYDGTEREAAAERIYDKLNRVYYREAKNLGMSAPNYIMTNIINRSN